MMQWRAKGSMGKGTDLPSGSLTSEASAVANPETLQTLTKDPNLKFKVPQWNIARDMKKQKVFNRTSKKNLGFTSSKRWLIPNSPSGDSLPFGYVCDPLDDLLHQLEVALDE